MTLTQSTRNELKDKGVIETEVWGIAGFPTSNILKETIVTASAVVDAAVSGLDLGEVVTIPSLPEASEWEVFKPARRKLIPNLSREMLAERSRTRAGA